MNNFKITEIAQFKPFYPIDDFVITLFKECTPKILVVTDGSLSFSTGDFGLSDFIDTLENTNIHGMMPIVKTAHRSSTAADFSNFVFTNDTLSISQYDVVFLFGFSSSGSLPASEVDVISQFMDDGGGVFATGDHATLGKQLCGEIPRVKEMRRWDGPSASSAERLSTNDPGVDNTFTFADQSDAIPQKIYPAYTGTPASSEPHALLQHPTKKIIEVLPDHPHESECTVPASIEDTSVWPTTSTGETVSPELVALSMSYGGGFTFPNKEPIDAPRAFGAIAAYDGHLADVGRISTDATWHHFVNINLIATGSNPGLVANADAYERVSTYFGNIARWLMPKKVRRCLRWPIIVNLITRYPVAEFIPELLEKPDDLQTLVNVGLEFETTLARFFTPAERQAFAEDAIALHSDALVDQLKAIHKRPNDLTDAIARVSIPEATIRQAALGALVKTTAEVSDKLRQADGELKAVGGFEGLDKLAAAQMSSTFKDLTKVILASRNRLDMVLECC